MNVFMNDRHPYLFKNTEEARHYIAKFCWEGHTRFCLRCGARKVYRIRRERYRCSKCAYEFSDFTGRWINKLKLACGDWLLLVYLFEREISARKASQEMGISYPTVLKAFLLIRQTIKAHSEDGNGSPDLFKGVKMQKFRRISAKNFPLYLKEMEFRYKHRKKSISDCLLRYLCDFLPSGEWKS